MTWRPPTTSRRPSLRTTTGRLRIVGGSDIPSAEPQMAVPPGTYRVRVYASGFGTTSDDGLAVTTAIAWSCGQPRNSRRVWSSATPANYPAADDGAKRRVPNDGDEGRAVVGRV